MKNKSKTLKVEENECSDIELYNILNGGGIEANKAFEILYRRYSPRIYAYCRKVFGDIAVTDDVFQETFIKFYNMGTSGLEIHNINGYLITIARNVCLNEKNKKHNKNRITLEEFKFSTLDVPYEQKELSRLISVAMEMLPDDYREPLILREVYGHSYDEISQIVNATMPIVRTRIYRAKNKVREILKPFIEDVNKFQKEEYEDRR